ncbi:rCG29422, partial [Rattus norvegicus]
MWAAGGDLADHSICRPALWRLRPGLGDQPGLPKETLS